LLFENRTTAQVTNHLRIDEAYLLARENYPSIKQRDLITKTKEYSVSNASKGYLPSFAINGQATYQSDVTNFPFTLPIPGFKMPTYSKDQYKIYAEVDQVVYDGGIIKNQKKTAETNEIIQQQNLEIELYALYNRVNQLFFGIILMDEQIRQNELLKKDIQNGIDKLKALVSNGMAFRSSVDELSAQLLQVEQSKVELKATKTAYTDMLSFFINKPLTENSTLDKPATPRFEESINRPELLLYDFQKRSFDLQDELLKTQLRPKLNLFVQGGYGRPGLNMLNNDFSFFSIGGLRLNWNLGSLYTFQNQKHLVNINRKTVDIQKETFLFNTSLTQKQENAEIKKYLDLLKNDDEIIDLRRSVKNVANAQLENGVIHAHDFIVQVNAEDEAQQNKILHEIQLLQTQYNYQNTIGNQKK